MQAPPHEVALLDPVLFELAPQAGAADAQGLRGARMVPSEAFEDLQVWAFRLSYVVPAAARELAPRGVPAARCRGEIVGSDDSFRVRIAVRSMAFSSSRTLPGQG